MRDVLFLDPTLQHMVIPRFDERGEPDEVEADAGAAIEANAGFAFGSRGTELIDPDPRAFGGVVQADARNRVWANLRRRNGRTENGIQRHRQVARLRLDRDLATSFIRKPEGLRSETRVTELATDPDRKCTWGELHASGDVESGVVQVVVIAHRHHQAGHDRDHHGSWCRLRVRYRRSSC